MVEDESNGIARQWFARMVIAALLCGGMGIAAFLSFRKPHYACADILGPTPRPGYMAIMPPHWKAVAVVSLDGSPVEPDFSVWDEHDKLVCDSSGRDVR